MQFYQDFYALPVHKNALWDFRLSLNQPLLWQDFFLCHFFSNASGCRLGMGNIAVSFCVIHSFSPIYVLKPIKPHVNKNATKNGMYGFMHPCILKYRQAVLPSVVYPKNNTVAPL